MCILENIHSASCQFFYQLNDNGRIEGLFDVTEPTAETPPSMAYTLLLNTRFLIASNGLDLFNVCLQQHRVTSY